MAMNDDNRTSEPSFSPLPPATGSTSSAAAANTPMAFRKVQLSELVLREAIWRLRVARSVVTVAAMALARQNAEADADIASVLHKHVADALTTEIDALQTA